MLGGGADADERQYSAAAAQTRTSLEAVGADTNRERRDCATGKRPRRVHSLRDFFFASRSV